MAGRAVEAGVFKTATLLTGALTVLARRTHLLDLPVSRSAHSQPTPVGGGLAIALPFLAVVCYCFAIRLIPLPEFMALSAAVAVAVLGLLGDLQ